MRTRIDWYISIAEPRDVIEEMLPGDLDVCGWDLRKTLRLFAKCNLALNEWIGSPITYGEVPEFRRQLAELVPTFFNPIAAMNHYCNMAERALDGQLRRRQDRHQEAVLCAAPAVRLPLDRAPADAAAHRVRQAGRYRMDRS